MTASDSPSDASVDLPVDLPGNVRVEARRSAPEVFAASASTASPAIDRPRGLLREPRLAPVIGVDSHLPALTAARLQPEALRARLASTLAMPESGVATANAASVATTAAAAVPASSPAWAPEFIGDGRRLVERPLRQAAVLIPLVRRPGGLTILLTRRANHLNNHGGQVSFPGGRTDPEDVDATATALREAHEEVGIEPGEVEVIGRLPRYTTVTAYEVTPIVGLLAPPRALRPEAFEVAEVFEVPLAFLMDPSNHRHHEVEMQGLSRRFLSMPWGADAEGEPYFIWGATAAMLRNLYGFLAWDGC